MTPHRPSGGSTWPDGPLAHPEQVGPYKILQLLGEGGMGVVYEAEQTTPVRRRVALKVMKVGMDTREVVARFEAERQALVVMDHPGIAKVTDAGCSEAGRPYFIMELVKGIAITDYCDSRHLSTSERLELFISVCQAVQHAHQKGIIHRDLKPSNVLVTEIDGQPVPKIIDFGLAKAIGQRLTDKTLVTNYGQAMGTPAYMSPEQAEMSGLDVDTRTDIYSLGVMLYELLVGELPVDPDVVGMQNFIAQLVRREADPQTPSSKLATSGKRCEQVASSRRTDPPGLRRMLRGDLDWIVMKAIDKDRARRYETANALALDLQHYLAHEPVVARPPSARYRVAKFIRRNRGVVAAASVAATALIVGSMLATVGMVRATRAEASARREAETSNQVTNFVVDLFEVADPSESQGNTITAREILDRGAEDIQRGLDDQPIVRAKLMDVIGRVYANLGLYSDARPLLEEAAELRSGFRGREVELGQSLLQLAQLHGIEGRLDESLGAARQAIDLFVAANGEDDSLTALGMLQAGVSFRGLGEYDSAGAYLQRSLDIRERMFGPDHIETASGLNEMAWLYRVRGDPESAKAAYERAIPIAQRDLGEDDWRFADFIADYGVTWSDLHEPDSARVYYLRALAIRERTLGPDHRLVGSVLNNLGALEWRQNNLSEAKRYYQRSLEIKEQALGPESPDVALGLTNLALLEQSMGEYSEAKQAYERSLAIREKVFGPRHVAVANTLLNFGYLLRYVGLFDEAREALERSIAIQEETNGPEHPERLTALMNLGILFGDIGDYDRSRQSFERILAIGQDNAAVSERTIAGAQIGLADVYIHAGEFEGARQLLERALEVAPDQSEGVLRSAVAHRGLGSSGIADSLFARWFELLERNYGHESAAFAFNQARYWCIVGDYRRAIQSLKTAMDRGYADPWLLRSHELAVLRGNPEYEAIVAEVRRRAGIDKL